MSTLQHIRVNKNKKINTFKLICKIYDVLGFIIGSFSFLVFISEPIPGADISVSYLFLSKIFCLALISLLVFLKQNIFTYNYNRYNK